MIFKCTNCNTVYRQDDGKADPGCPRCIGQLADELEDGLQELIAQGKAVISGKTSDGRNLYTLLDS